MCASLFKTGREEPKPFSSADPLAAFSTKIKLAALPPAGAGRSVAIAPVFVLVGGRCVAGLDRNDLRQGRLVQLVAFDELGRGFHGDLALLLRILRDQRVDAAVLERADLGARGVISD